MIQGGSRGDLRWSVRSFKTVIAVTDRCKVLSLFRVVNETRRVLQGWKATEYVARVMRITTPSARDENGSNEESDFHDVKAEM